MNSGTPRGDDDELLRLYHAAADLEGGAPAPAVGDAVRAHARVMAASRRPADAPDVTVVPHGGQDTAANTARWRLSMLASLAVIALAGLLVLQFDRGTPHEQGLVGAPGGAAPQAESASQDATASAKATDAQLGAAPAAAPTEAARVGPDARSAQAPATMRDRAVRPVPPQPVARAGKDAEAPSVAPAMTPPGVADATGSSRAAPSSHLPAPGARPGAAPADVHGMAAAGDWPALASQLAAGTAIDVRDSQGRTLLMHAAAAGHVDMVRRLLDAGADPRLVDAGGRTAGDGARRAKRFEIAAMLDDAQRKRGAGR